MLNTTGLHPTIAAIFQDASRIPATDSPFAALTDTQLQAEAKRLATRVSFFNAAEGNWSQERDARNAASSDFRACCTELDRRGIAFVNDQGWLL